MRVSASPQVISLKRPASDKGKGDRSSLSLPAASVSLSLSPFPSCFVLKFERWRTNYSSNF